jgi:hypothetical protein
VCGPLSHLSHAYKTMHPAACTCCTSRQGMALDMLSSQHRLLQAGLRRERAVGGVPGAGLPHRGVQCTGLYHTAPVQAQVPAAGAPGVEEEGTALTRWRSADQVAHSDGAHACKQQEQTARMLPDLQPRALAWPCLPGSPTPVRESGVGGWCDSLGAAAAAAACWGCHSCRRPPC